MTGTMSNEVWLVILIAAAIGFWLVRRSQRRDVVKELIEAIRELGEVVAADYPDSELLGDEGPALVFECDGKRVKIDKLELLEIAGTQDRAQRRKQLALLWERARTEQPG